MYQKVQKVLIPSEILRGHHLCGSTKNHLVLQEGHYHSYGYEDNHLPEMEYKQVTTTCPYCGTGCSLNLVVTDNVISGTAPHYRSPVNEGKLCPKGTYSWQFINSRDRLKKPLIRKGDVFIESDYADAYALIAEQFRYYRPDEIAVLSSARCTNEENYIMGKFARGVLRTRHIDHCARLCHSSTIAGLSMCFGNGAMTNSIPDITESGCIFCLGSNTFEQHPLVGRRIIQAQKKGATFIYADPRYTPTARQADLSIQFYSGGDVALLNCMMGEIIRNEWTDADFIRDHTRDYENLRKVVLQRRYLPENVRKTTGVPAEQLKAAAQLYSTAKTATILYSMGVTQHTVGVDNVKSVANLAMLTGNIGKPGSGVNALRGQNNVQGACDMGCLPNVFPGYQKVTDGRVHKFFSDSWGFPGPISDPRPGYEITTMFRLLLDRPWEIKCMYLMGENPLVSEPDLNSVEDAIQNLEFLVVQDIFFTETCRYADVVLPAACYAEKNGTQTNTERRVQRIRKAQEPPGEAKPDWQIICELADIMGYGDQFPYQSEEEIFQEISSTVPQYAGITWNQTGQPGGVQWPCPERGHPGTPILYTDRFETPDGRGIFHAVEYKAPHEMPDESYPFLFTTGRIIWHWQTGTMTRRSKNLTDEVNEAYIELNADDAREMGIREGEIVRITSRRGELTCPARVVKNIMKGVTFMPFHFAECAANRLTSDAYDPVAKIPEYKVCAVRVERIRGD